MACCSYGSKIQAAEQMVMFPLHDTYDLNTGYGMLIKGIGNFTIKDLSKIYFHFSVSA